MTITRFRRAVSGAAVTAIALSGAVLAAQPAVADAGLVAHYPLDETTGTLALDASGSGNDAAYVGSPTLTGAEGVRLDGTDDHVKLPDDILAGLDSITISADVLIRESQRTPYFIYGFGNTDDAGVGDGYLFSSGNSYRASIATGNWSTEQTVNSGSNLTRDRWQTITYTLDDATDTARLYLDGVEVAEQDGITIRPGDIGNGATSANALGRSVYTADNHLAGSLRNVRIYDAALAEEQVAGLVPSDETRLERDAAVLTLGDLSAVTADLALPSTAPNGSAIAWTSDDAAVSATGAVTRPAAGEPAVQVTLTAELSRGSATHSLEFVATVLPMPGAAALAQEDLDTIVIPNAQDIRGHITLPDEGAINGSEIVWTASPEGVITTTETDGKRAGVVTRGDADTAVTLTASVPGTEAVRDIDVTVTAAPVDLDTDYTAGYLWTHFHAQGGYEKIFFGHSEDGLHWSKLNDNNPILANLGGDLGVRDPHLIRSPEGDRYWIIGTDLHAEGGGPGGSGWDQLNASQNLVVWESTDLVSWSDQRIVFAGFPHAGNVWAPEAIYDEASGEYYVYWSARDRRDHETEDWALRVYVTTTRDFVTFTEPQIWASLNEQGDGAGGPNIIDSTIAKEGDTYYRFSTSDWHTIVDTAPSLDGPWTTVIGRGDAAGHGLRGSMEGLTVYQLPDGRWAVMGDQSGYYGHIADTLESLQFTQLSVGAGPDQYSFDQRFRHGSVIQLSAAEEQRLLEAYGADAEEPGEPGEPGEAQGLIAEYTFDDGTLADGVGDGDLSAHGTAAVVQDPERGQVLQLDGSSGGYAAFPTGLFDGLDQLTISLDMRSDLTSGNFFSLAFGQDNQEYYFLRDRGGDIRSAITQTSWQNESAVTGSVGSGQWHRYDLVFDDNTMVVYVDGVKLGENTELSATVSDLGSDLVGYLGRSFYSADRYFQGAYDNIRIYDVALPADELLGKDQLIDVSLTDPSVLKIDPIVAGADRTVTFPVVPGTDLTALAPTFTAPAGVEVAPASGTVVDLTEPVDYTLTAEDGTTYVWTFSAVEVGSPVLPGLYADPNIAVFGDTYYIYATSDGYPGWGGKEFYVWKSKDLVDWERADEPFLTLDGADGNVPWASGNAWAPTIIERDGKYYFYFSGHNDSVNRKTIGVAVADHPEGPFVAEPTAMILNNEAVTSGQAIDPAAFLDPESGKYFLYWGNGRPVYAELADDMVSLVPGTIREQHGLTNYREGTFVNYRDGRYHLTYSIDDTGSPDYRVGYATADSPHGPWTYRGVILEKDPSLGILGTGHNSVINVPGTDDWYIVYHRFAIPDGNGNNRETTIDRITFDEDGFMERVTPTLESVGPQLIELPSAEPELDVYADTRCVVGRTTLAVRVTNESAEPVEATISTAYGTRTVTVGAQSASSVAFSSRLASIPAGEVVVTTGDETVEPVTATYAARSCR